MTLQLGSFFEGQLQTGNLTERSEVARFQSLFGTPSSTGGASFSRTGCKEHVLIRPIVGHVIFEWKQRVLRRCLQTFGLPATAPQSFFLRRPLQEYSASLNTSMTDEFVPMLSFENLAATGTTYFNLTQTLPDELNRSRGSNSLSSQHKSSDYPFIVLASNSSRWRELWESRPWQASDLRKEESRHLRVKFNRLDIRLDSRDLHAMLRLIDWLNLGEDHPTAQSISPSQLPRSSIIARRLSRIHSYRSMCCWERDGLIGRNRRSDAVRRALMTEMKKTFPVLQPYPSRSRIRGFESPEVVFARYARSREAAPTVSKAPSELFSADIQLAGMSLSLSLEHRSRLRQYRSEQGTETFGTRVFGSLPLVWEEEAKETPQPPIEGLPVAAIIFGSLKISSAAEFQTEHVEEDSPTEMYEPNGNCPSMSVRREPDRFVMDERGDMGHDLRQKWKVEGSMAIR